MGETEKTPGVFIDWDFDTFDINEKGQIFLYDIEYDNMPEYVYISGFPYPGGPYLNHELAKLVSRESPLYEIVKQGEVG